MDYWERYEKDPFLLIEERSTVTIEEVKALMRACGVDECFVCDAYIKDIEKTGILMEYGYVLRSDGMRIVNIDHHAPVKEFERHISATNLALLYLRKYGTARPDALVIINHTDADAIMSAALIKGVFGRVDDPREETALALLESFEPFGQAAIAADHTGEENDVADILQAFKFERDIEGSLQNLERVLCGEELLPRGQELWDARCAERERARELVANGAFRSYGLVRYACLKQNVDLAFLPALLPEASIIMTFVPSKRNPERTVVRLRLGPQGVGRLILNRLGLGELDPLWKGRFNAGSNRRAGGALIDLPQYVAFVDRKAEEYMENNAA